MHSSAKGVQKERDIIRYLVLVACSRFWQRNLRICGVTLCENISLLDPYFLTFELREKYFIF